MMDAGTQCPQKRKLQTHQITSGQPVVSPDKLHTSPHTGSSLGPSSRTEGFLNAILVPDRIRVNATDVCGCMKPVSRGTDATESRALNTRQLSGTFLLNSRTKYLNSFEIQRTSTNFVAHARASERVACNLLGVSPTKHDDIKSLRHVRERTHSMQA